MDFPIPWLVIVATIIGHFGLNVAIYNRINGTAIPRWTLEKNYQGTSGLDSRYGSGIGRFFVFRIHHVDFFWGRPSSSSPLTSHVCYAVLVPCCLVWCLVFHGFFGAPFLSLSGCLPKRRVDVIQVQTTTDNSLALTSKCKIARHLPWNQILELSVEEIDLPVRGLPEGLDGYRIAHLSDIHLTGDIHPDFAGYAVLRAAQWQPDMMALTGDIIDKQTCVDWLVDIFSPVDCRDGCFFVLGNHDTRIVDSRQTREAMSRAGWTDLGGRSLRGPLADGVEGMLIGNEYPWYSRPQIPTENDPAFRILLSHSPDQLWWARRHHVSLMLAGHTHGGQGRLPLAGPILGPSYHGSRFAAGDFYRAPTTLHVSRGLSGTHLLRLNCRPELSLITLRAQPVGVEST